MDSKFKCENCGREVKEAGDIGTRNRNHCPFCLYSEHLDQKISGDRQANCYGPMKPVGLTFKEEGPDKYGRKKQGEIMLVHLCQKCDSLSINRIAGDDDEKMILKIFKNSNKPVPNLKAKIQSENIKMLDKNDEPEIRVQLFGKQ